MIAFPSRSHPVPIATYSLKTAESCGWESGFVHICCGGKGVLGSRWGSDSYVGPMADVLGPENDELDWGPPRRFDKLRAFIGQATLQEIAPAVLIAIGAIVVAFGGWLLWSPSRAPDAPSLAVSRVDRTELADSVAPELADRVAKPIVVHVAGHVVSPGLVEVDTDARVFHAIEAAGGALPDAHLDAINLAALVVNGSQIFVPTEVAESEVAESEGCLLYTSPSPRDATLSRMPSSA